jgi:hypothetical protein
LVSPLFISAQLNCLEQDVFNSIFLGTRDELPCIITDVNEAQDIDMFLMSDQLPAYYTAAAADWVCSFHCIYKTSCAFAFFLEKKM